MTRLTAAQRRALDEAREIVLVAMTKSIVNAASGFEAYEEAAQTLLLPARKTSPSGKPKRRYHTF